MNIINIIMGVVLILGGISCVTYLIIGTVKQVKDIKNKKNKEE